MPFQPKHIGAALAFGAAALVAGNGLAQTTPPANPPAGAAPPPGAPPQGGPPPQGPFKIDLQQAPTEWAKICGKPPGANPKELCVVTHDFVFSDPRQPPLALAVYAVQGDDTRLIRVLMPTALLIKPGVRLSIDKGAQQEGSYQFCLPNGCFVESKVKPATVDSMKKGTQLNIVAKNMNNDEVTFQLPLSGFGKSFDGPAIDPKVLQAQQEAQQQELQKQLEERARQQRQNLEQGSAPGTVPPPPAAAPAVK